MFCPKCLNEISDDDTACPHCGILLVEYGFYGDDKNRSKNVLARVLLGLMLVSVAFIFVKEIVSGELTQSTGIVLVVIIAITLIMMPQFLKKADAMYSASKKAEGQKRKSVNVKPPKR